jgi:hypothetical protein
VPRGTRRARISRGRIRAAIGLRLWAIGVVLGLAGAGATVASAGGVYRYIDAEGVVHFTDAPLDDRRFDRVEHAPQEGLVITPPKRASGPAQQGYDALIEGVAGRHGVHPALVKAVIAAESNFQPSAVSHAGAQGMMQLMPATAAELGVAQPFGVVENIDGGVRYLRAMLERYGDVRRALAAYNAGPSRVDRYGGVPPYRETQAYVQRVLEYYRGYWNDFERTAPAVPTRIGTRSQGAIASRVAASDPSVGSSERSPHHRLGGR